LIYQFYTTNGLHFNRPRIKVVLFENIIVSDSLAEIDSCLKLLNKN